MNLIREGLRRFATKRLLESNRKRGWPCAGVVLASTGLDSWDDEHLTLVADGLGGATVHHTQDGAWGAPNSQEKDGWRFDRQADAETLFYKLEASGTGADYGEEDPTEGLDWHEIVARYGPQG